jgi:hypothetical protein
LFGHAATIHQGGEMATAKKIGVVAAISASLVAGGVATEKAIVHHGDQQAPVTRQAQHQAIRALAPPAIKPTHSAKKAKHAASRSSRHKAHNATESDAVGKNSGSQVTSQSAPAADPQGVSVPSDPNAAPALPQNVSSHGGSSDNSTGLAP